MVKSMLKCFVFVAFHLQEFRGAVDLASKSLGRPVIPDAVLNQIIRYLPQLQLINEDLLSDLKQRIDNWYACFLPALVLFYFVTQLLVATLIMLILKVKVPIVSVTLSQLCERMVGAHLHLP